MTAVQSVYIAAGVKAVPSSQLSRLGPLDRRVLLALALVMPCGLELVVGGPSWAGVVFDNCQTLPGGAVSCDTRPTHNTLDNDEDARYGLFSEASPGWNEFDPEEGYNGMAGLNEY